MFGNSLPAKDHSVVAWVNRTSFHFFIVFVYFPLCSFFCWALVCFRDLSANLVVNDLSTVQQKESEKPSNLNTTEVMTKLLHTEHVRRQNK